MCSELLLAFLYFIIIFVVNLYITFLLPTLFSSITGFQKLKKIQKTYKVDELNWIIFFYIYNKNQAKIEKSIPSSNFENLLHEFHLKNFIDLELKDSLLIGHIYKQLKDTKKSKNYTNFYYFYLLESQYKSKFYF